MEKEQTIIPDKVKQEAVLSNIQSRKSVRNYIADKTISKEDITTLIKAGMAAPSGKDVRPWEIIVVDNKEILATLAEKLPYAKMLKHAPLAIVVCGNKEKSSYWYLDCSAVTQNILLAAEALGLGAVWTAAYPYDDRMNAVTESIGLPENVLPLNVIPIGYPEGETKPKDKYDESKIHYNAW
ncbi:nitroreductase family protein [Paludibacter sp. 221]|uniref:nitroreductase family protein n=1 Tax=Paludibacter sp. 221 TaxID=2302939 RepID=UPI0013D29AB1|nr:nitroreductase family protein [Paludibacter sp. 221]NDV45748.1 nitroreductase family protein [Paludibacter sp. 221]